MEENLWRLRGDCGPNYILPHLFNYPWKPFASSQLDMQLRSDVRPPVTSPRGQRRGSSGRLRRASPRGPLREQTAGVAQRA